MKREAAWQHHAAPLAIIRELREAMIADMILHREIDPEKLRPILELESELQRKAYVHDWRSTLHLLNLDHGRSWAEMVDWLKATRRIALAVKFEAFVGILRPIIDELHRDLRQDG